MKSLFASSLVIGSVAAEVPPMKLSAGLLSLTVPCVIVFMVLPFAAGMLAKRRAHFANISAAVPQISSLRIAREFLWLLVPLGVLGTFAMMGSPTGFTSAFVGLPNENDLALERMTANSSIPLQEPLPLPTDDRRRPADPDAASHRPGWLDQPRVVDGDRVSLVLASQQYSTREEAEAELRSATARLVQDDLERIQAGMFRPAHWQPSSGDVVRHAVQQRYVEVIERDFGSFFHPMYRVWWQVELSPAVRSEFLPAWRQALIQYRIAVVGVFLSVLAMLASSLVMYFRMDGLTRGSARRKLQVLASGTMIGWTALITAALFHGPQWFAGRLW